MFPVCLRRTNSITVKTGPLLLSIVRESVIFSKNLKVGKKALIRVVFKLWLFEDRTTTGIMGKTGELERAPLL